MDILVKGDSAAFTFCPECHGSIRHGSQICENCGQGFSTQSLDLSVGGDTPEQNTLYMLATVSSILAGAFYVLNHYFSG